MMSLTCTRGAPAMKSSAANVSAFIFSALPITRETSGISANAFGSICAAQPVTMIEADPEMPARLVDEINGGGKKSISREEQQATVAEAMLAFLSYTDPVA